MIPILSTLALAAAAHGPVHALAHAPLPWPLPSPVAAAKLAVNDLVVAPGQLILYDTNQGPLLVDNLTIQAGGTLRAQGGQPLVIFARTSVTVDGTLDAGGFDAKSVGTLFTPNQPEPGAPGAAGGGAGGVGSPVINASSPQGGSGQASGIWSVPGGIGGEAGYSSSTNKDERRSGGGGGGAFGPDEAGGGFGLVATAGGAGHPVAIGAQSGQGPPQGGGVNARPFVDGDPTNDFWGVKLTGGGALVGELPFPRAGVGGGAGGDSIQSGSFPTIPFGPPYKDKKGAGGGGGGGLAVVLTPTLTVGASGRLAADGGDGATGENQLGFDHIAGSSGGGSGGMWVLQAGTIDLSRAGNDAITAVGGAGGIGSQGVVDYSFGGNGGPGLIQLHVRHAGHVLLPAGAELADLTAPDAHVLQPQVP